MLKEAFEITHVCGFPLSFCCLPVPASADVPIEGQAGAAVALDCDRGDRLDARQFVLHQVR